VNIDPTSAVPIYQQITDDICQAIAAGVYRPGEMIPSIRATSLKTTVNPNTVKRAYELLERRGLVRVRKGLGMFVTTHGAKQARTRSEEAVSAAFARGIRAALAAGIPPSKVMTSFRKAWREVHKEERLKT
jgi:GntR family transcriptional regulator